MKRIGVLTSGGDAPGMNAAVRAVVRACAYHEIEVFGIQQGYRGMLENEMAPLTARDVSGIIDLGGTMLRTARCKAFYDAAGRELAARNLRAHGIEGFVVIGGDGSYRGAHALHKEYGIAGIGIPGTIDNDIGGTDFTIGFDTAMNTAVGVIDRLRDTAASHGRIFFVEAMGRHSGYLALVAGIAGGAEEILVPEEPTDIDQLAQRLRGARQRGKQSLIVVVAEGDDAGNAMTISQRLAEISEFTDTRVSIIGHIQRGGSPSAFDRVLASRMGVRAVEALLAGETDKMVGIAGIDLVLRPLSDAWEMRTAFNTELLRMSKILGI